MDEIQPLSSKRSAHHTARGEEQKQAIINAAYDLIAERGFEGLRTREVAARSNLTTATLHYYFPTKEDLVRGVAQRLHTEFEMEAAARPPAAGRPAVEVLHDEFLDQQKGAKNRPATYLVLLELYGRSLRDPEVRPAIQELLDHWEAHLLELINNGVKSGQFAKAIDPERTAKTLQCLLMGSVTSLLVRRGEDLDLEEIYRQVLEWLQARTPT